MSEARTQLFPSLSLRAKLTLLVLVLALIAVALAYMQVQQARGVIQRAQLEQAGATYLEGAEKLLEDVVEHRALAHRRLLLGDEVAEEITERTNAIDAGLQALLGRQGTGFDTLESLNLVQNNWRALKARAEALSAEQSLAAHNRLVDDLLAHALQTAEVSGLRTSPELGVFLSGGQLPGRHAPGRGCRGATVGGGRIHSQRSLGGRRGNRGPTPRL